MSELASRFLSDESGATVIEYALIATGVFLGIISVVRQVGVILNTPFVKVTNNLT